MATFLIEIPAGKLLNLYVHVKDSTLKTNNGSAYETFSVANWTNYSLTLVETDLSTASPTISLYQVTVGTVYAGAKYGFVFEREGASPASTDTQVGMADITQTDAVTAPTTEPYSETNIKIQLESIQTAINAALLNPRPNWKVGQVSMEQGSYLKMLIAQQKELIEELKRFPAEDISTSQHEITALGADMTDYKGEPNF